MTQPTAEQIELARECAAEVWIGLNEHAAIHMLRYGQCDHYREVQSALFAIQATEARMADAVEALEPFSKALEKRQLLCKDDEFVTWSAITVGDLRKARQALAKIRSQSDG